MGLFSFLSRKVSQDPRDLALLKASQPYNATVAALPPIRGMFVPGSSWLCIGVSGLRTLTGCRCLSGSRKWTQHFGEFAKDATPIC